MRYKLLLLDIDGTLRPGSCEQIPKENAAAVRAVQKAGVKIAIATGRGRTGVGKGLLRSIPSLGNAKITRERCKDKAASILRLATMVSNIA